MSGSGRGERLARALADKAAHRLRRDRGDWGRAMLAETEAIGSQTERLHWALGCLTASHRAQGGSVFYPVALLLGVAALTWQQWSADEGVVTCLLLALSSLGLGLLDSRRVVWSGLAVGSVVAAVHVFGAVTGVRPPYETHLHGALHGLRWIVLVGPALVFAWGGARLASILDD